MARRRRKRHFLRNLILILIFIGTLFALTNVGMRLLPKMIDSTQEAIGQVVTSRIPFSEIIIQETDVADGYYYQSLDEHGQTVYKEILQGVREQAESIYLHSADSEEIGRIYGFVICDRPELFWCTGEMHITSYSDYSEAKPTYSCTGEVLQQKQTEIDTAVQECLSGISSDASEYDRVRYIFEYLVNAVDYDLNSTDNQNIYSALVNRTSVCAGYSRAAQYLLQKTGMECLYVTGEIPNQGSHAWNIVKCNGQYYQLDVTFGDPVFVQEENGTVLPEGSINYAYLCCTDEELYQNHVPDDLVVLPQCTSMDLNYFVLNGMYYDSYDPDIMLENMNQSIYNMENTFICKFAGNELYQQAHDDILNNLLPQAAQNLAYYYGLTSVEYTYVEDEVTNQITIYWNYH